MLKLRHLWLTSVTDPHAKPQTPETHLHVRPTCKSLDTCDSPSPWQTHMLKLRHLWLAFSVRDTHAKVYTPVTQLLRGRLTCQSLDTCDSPSPWETHTLKFRHMWLTFSVTLTGPHAKVQTPVTHLLHVRPTCRRQCPPCRAAWERDCSQHARWQNVTRSAESCCGPRTHPVQSPCLHLLGKRLLTNWCQ